MNRMLVPAIATAVVVIVVLVTLSIQDVRSRSVTMTCHQNVAFASTPSGITRVPDWDWRCP